MPTPVPSCALLFRGGELLSFARRCDRSGPLQRLGHEQPRHARAGDDIFGGVVAASRALGAARWRHSGAAACALSRDDDRQRICRYLTAPYKCRCNFLAFSAADGRSRLYPQARHAGEREPPGDLMKEVECAGRGPLMLGRPASSGDRMRLGSRRSAPAGRHPRPYKTGEQGRRRSPRSRSFCSRCLICRGGRFA